ncbi:MAG: hypothetical protein M5U20_12740 [Phycisphaerales bacterium]|nr:hypothetical protein [Phycisphaerales bacterium]
MACGGPVSRRLKYATLGLSLAAGLARAGGTPENVLLIIDPLDRRSLEVGHHYKAVRGIPDTHVLYMEPGAADYASFVQFNLPALFATIERRGLWGQVDYIVISSSDTFYLNAPNLVSDGCSPVTRFSLSGAYTLAFVADEILAGGLTSAYGNRYFGGSNTPQRFDSEYSWLSGNPSNDPNARRYFIGALLGYTGTRGNSAAETIAMIDRSAAVDGTRPAGTFYFMQTTDQARSGPRHNAYPAAVSAITNLGGQAEHLFAVLPEGRHDCLGIMTGIATLDVPSANLTILPGAFCDHLTSYAATFDVGAQTKMSHWITNGASGTWGTVEEPCNYPGKFPHARAHVYYFQGMSLGESVFRSVSYAPFQGLLYGDPITRPHDHIPPPHPHHHRRQSPPGAGQRHHQPHPVRLHHEARRLDHLLRAVRGRAPIRRRLLLPDTHPRHHPPRRRLARHAHPRLRQLAHHFHRQLGLAARRQQPRPIRLDRRTENLGQLEHRLHLRGRRRRTRTP